MGQDCLCELFREFVQSRDSGAEDLQADDGTVAAFLDFVNEQQQRLAGVPDRHCWPYDQHAGH